MSQGSVAQNLSCLTFLAIMTLVAACCTLLTVPPLPAPSSLRTMRSSDRRSRRNSTPISRVSPLSTLPIPPGIWASPAEGAAFGAGAFRAKFLMFFLFIVFVLKASAMVTARARPHRGKAYVCGEWWARKDGGGGWGVKWWRV